MPAAGHTTSTTRITLPQDSKTWLERVDAGIIRPEHAHPSLVVMTTTVQATFGALVMLLLLHALDTATLTLLTILTAIALSVSVFHLGRPAHAWRALKMWRRSWLSREVLCFGLFFAVIGASTAASWAGALHLFAAGPVVLAAAIAAAIVGLLGTLASAYIYLVPARPAWNMLHTPADFLLSAALMGSVFPALLNKLAFTTSALASHVGFALPHIAFHTPVLPAAVIAGLWLANHFAKKERLKRSILFEARASYNLLHSAAMAWPTLLMYVAAVLTPILLANHLPLLALIACIAAVATGRTLFFVSVVPLNMALTFVRTRSA